MMPILLDRILTIMRTYMESIVYTMILASAVLVPILVIVTIVDTHKREDTACKELYGDRYDHQTRIWDDAKDERIHPERTVCINIDTYEEKPVK